MKMYEGCSGDCCTCAHEGCCPAVNGKDCYCLAPKEKLIERLKTGKYKRYLYIMIDTLKDSYGYDYEKAPVTRKCKECGKEFEPTTNRQIFCCKECQVISNNRKTSSLSKEARRLAKEHKAMAKKPGEKNSIEIAVTAKKMGYASYGKYVAATEYPVKIERKW